MFSLGLRELTAQDTALYYTADFQIATPDAPVRLQPVQAHTHKYHHRAQAAVVVVVVAGKLAQVMKVVVVDGAGGVIHVREMRRREAGVAGLQVYKVEVAVVAGVCRRTGEHHHHQSFPWWTDERRSRC